MWTPGPRGIQNHRYNDSVVSSELYDDDRISRSRSTNSDKPELKDIQTESRMANVVHGLLDVFENKINQ